MYLVQKNLTKLKNDQCTGFLDPKELEEVKRKLEKNTYSIYKPYNESEKNIIYTKKEPKVLLYKIKNKVDLRHQDILGTMYSLNISPELFGDILLVDGKWYIYILESVRNYFESNFLMVKNSRIELEEVDLECLLNYEKGFEYLGFIVSSNRIDTIVSSICHIGRSNVASMIKNKEIMLNYDYLKDGSYKLKDNDIFSIKRVGKFVYSGVLKYTKSNHMIIEIKKYL